jgi:hypothetical protein
MDLIAIRTYEIDDGFINRDYLYRAGLRKFVVRETSNDPEADCSDISFNMEEALHWLRDNPRQVEIIDIADRLDDLDFDALNCAAITDDGTSH